MSDSLPLAKDNITNIEDELEGLDNSQIEGWGTGYPLDSVFVRTEVRTVKEVNERIKKNAINLTLIINVILFGLLISNRVLSNHA